jgi:DNA-binding transcriptional regulator LsrR (DeoR family)
LPWKDKIAGCFADANQTFAGSKSASDYALRLLTEMREIGVSWGEARDAFKDHLTTSAKLKRQRFLQMRRITALVKPWLQC